MELDRPGLPNYRSYPRIVGETGGKDFVFAHASADLEALAVALVRGAFGTGTECSAASRAYVPASSGRRSSGGSGLLAEVKMGSPLDFRNFMAAVIDKASFDNTMSYIAHAKASNDAEIVFGGEGTTRPATSCSRRWCAPPTRASS